MARLSSSRMLRKTVPDSGNGSLDPRCALANALPKSRSRPITSPVDFISGPNSTSSPGKRLNGSTGFLTLTNEGSAGAAGAMSARRSPAITRAASRANGSPTALLTNGTVREARGLASSTNTWSLRTANCTLSNPRTPNACASLVVCSRICCSTGSPSVNGGMTQVESPEWMPASSMCSMMPATSTVAPSATASTSTSRAASRNLSINTGSASPTIVSRSSQSSRSSCAYATRMPRPPST